MYFTCHEVLDETFSTMMRYLVRGPGGFPRLPRSRSSRSPKRPRFRSRGSLASSTRTRPPLRSLPSKSWTASSASLNKSIKLETCNLSRMCHFVPKIQSKLSFSLKKPSIIKQWVYLIKGNRIPFKNQK